MTIVIADPVVESFTKQSEYVIRIQNRINTSSFVTTLFYVEASTPDRHIHQWASLSRVAVSQKWFSTVSLPPGCSIFAN